MENGVFGKIQKTLDTKQARIKKKTVDTFLILKSQVHNTNYKFCTGILNS